jgi:hypothetical protein
LIGFGGADENSEQETQYFVAVIQDATSHVEQKFHLRVIGRNSPSADQVMA